jgi:hypothetical protein
MSIIKITILLFFLSFSCISFSQDTGKQKTTIYLDFNDKALKEYYIDKDTTSAFFNIYIERYQTKEARDKVTNEYYNDPRDRNSVGIPSFSIGFYVFDLKPEKLKSLDCIKYITVKQFRENGYKTTSPTYVIHKLKDGIYLKWKTYTLN